MNLNPDDIHEIPFVEIVAMVEEIVAMVEEIVAMVEEFVGED